MENVVPVKGQLAHSRADCRLASRHPSRHVHLISTIRRRYRLFVNQPGLILIERSHRRPTATVITVRILPQRSMSFSLAASGMWRSSPGPKWTKSSSLAETSFRYSANPRVAPGIGQSCNHSDLHRRRRIPRRYRGVGGSPAQELGYFTHRSESPPALRQAVEHHHR
jgi:hypothetical protein